MEPCTAARRLHAWIKRNPALESELQENGWVKSTRILPPRLVKIIISYLDPP